MSINLQIFLNVLFHVLRTFIEVETSASNSFHGSSANSVGIFNSPEGLTDFSSRAPLTHLHKIGNYKEVLGHYLHFHNILGDNRGLQHGPSIPEDNSILPLLRSNQGLRDVPGSYQETHRFPMFEIHGIQQTADTNERFHSFNGQSSVLGPLIPSIVLRKATGHNITSVGDRVDLIGAKDHDLSSTFHEFTKGQHVPDIKLAPIVNLPTLQKNEHSVLKHGFEIPVQFTSSTGENEPNEFEIRVERVPIVGYKTLKKDDGLHSDNLSVFSNNGHAAGTLKDISNVLKKIPNTLHANSIGKYGEYLGHFFETQFGENRRNKDINPLDHIDKMIQIHLPHIRFPKHVIFSFNNDVISEKKILDQYPNFYEHETDENLPVEKTISFASSNNQTNFKKSDYYQILRSTDLENQVKSDENLLEMIDPLKKSCINHESEQLFINSEQNNSVINKNEPLNNTNTKNHTETLPNYDFNNARFVVKRLALVPQHSFVHRSIPSALSMWSLDTSLYSESKNAVPRIPNEESDDPLHIDLFKEGITYAGSENEIPLYQTSGGNEQNSVNTDDNKIPIAENQSGKPVKSNINNIIENKHLVKDIHGDNIAYDAYKYDKNNIGIEYGFLPLPYLPYFLSYAQNAVTPYYEVVAVV